MDKAPTKYKQSIISSSLIYLCTASVIGCAYLYESRPSRSTFIKADKELSKQSKQSFMTPIFLQSVKQVQVHGAQGNFQLEKQQGQNGSWRFMGKGRYPAQSNKVIELLTSFATVKVVRAYDLNLSNSNIFGLQQPVMELTLSSSKTLKHVKVGKVDLIKKTAFLKLADSPKVYQVSFKSFPFHNLVAQNFIQDEVIHFDLEKLESIKITKSRYNRTKINLRKGNQRWISSKNKAISISKVQELLSNIQSLKVDAILNKENLDSIKLNKFMGRIAYQLELTSGDTRTKLKLQRIKKNIPTLTMKTQNKFLLTNNRGKNPMIISKDQLKFFSVSESQLTNLRISDVIY